MNGVHVQVGSSLRMHEKCFTQIFQSICKAMWKEFVYNNRRFLKMTRVE